VNLTNLHLANQIEILNACLMLSALGLSVFWFRPVQVGNLPAVATRSLGVDLLRAHLQQSGIAVRSLFVILASFATKAFLPADSSLMQLH